MPKGSQTHKLRNNSLDAHMNMLVTIFFLGSGLDVKDITQVIEWGERISRFLWLESEPEIGKKQGGLSRI